jgi:hypothetical protein
MSRRCALWRDAGWCCVAAPDGGTLFVRSGWSYVAAPYGVAAPDGGTLFVRSGWSYVAAPYGGTLVGVASLRLMAGRSLCGLVGHTSLRLMAGRWFGLPPPTCFHRRGSRGCGWLFGRLGVGRSGHIGFAACSLRFVVKGSHGTSTCANSTVFSTCAAQDVKTRGETRLTEGHGFGICHVCVRRVSESDR